MYVFCKSIVASGELPKAGHGGGGKWGACSVAWVLCGLCQHGSLVQRLLARFKLLRVLEVDQKVGVP